MWNLYSVYPTLFRSSLHFSCFGFLLYIYEVSWSLLIVVSHLVFLWLNLFSYFSLSQKSHQVLNVIHVTFFLPTLRLSAGLSLAIILRGCCGHGVVPVLTWNLVTAFHTVLAVIRSALSASMSWQSPNASVFLFLPSEKRSSGCLWKGCLWRGCSERVVYECCYQCVVSFFEKGLDQKGMEGCFIKGCWVIRQKLVRMFDCCRWLQPKILWTKQGLRKWELAIPFTLPYCALNFHFFLNQIILPFTSLPTFSDLNSRLWVEGIYRWQLWSKMEIIVTAWNGLIV